MNTRQRSQLLICKFLGQSVSKINSSERTFFTLSKMTALRFILRECDVLKTFFFSTFMLIQALEQVGESDGW